MSSMSLDTNVLMYLYDSKEERKRNINESLLTNEPSISAQVVSEFLNVTKRLLKLPKKEILEKCSKVVFKCTIIPMSQETLESALVIMLRYDFQFFDSIIVASALEANCSILYSEDLQHKQSIENRLTIINPFL